MERDLELETWRHHWQSASIVRVDLRERVERETRMMRRFVWAEVAVTMVVGGGAVGWAALSRRIDVLVLAIGTWAFIAIAWTISSQLRRGAWTPATATTSAFLELSILRCRRRREALIAQVVLYFLILGFDLAWIYSERTQRTPVDPIIFLTTGVVLWVWAITGALAIIAARYRRRLDRELQNLLRLQQQIVGPASSV
jgi:hypothetical protein